MTLKSSVEITRTINGIIFPPSLSSNVNNVNIKITPHVDTVNTNC